MTLELIVMLICSIALLLFGLKIIFVIIGTELKKRVVRRYPGCNYHLISFGANFFGQTSKGYKQLRGNGALVLAYNELWFSMALPKRELTIPISSIRSITLPNSFLGKSILKPLLCVEFETDGGSDSAAWALKDPQAWHDKLDSLQSTVMV